MKIISEQCAACHRLYVLAIHDAQNGIMGKWKIPIISILLQGKKRFNEIEREIPGITPRMLSKELKELEMNGILTRKEFDDASVRVEYELTSSGYALKKVLDVMIEWGLEHRKMNVASLFEK